MDYGTYLGKTVPNPNRKSKHYTKQSKFEGSNRQVRGGILKVLLNGELSKEELVLSLGLEEGRVYGILRELQNEGFINERMGKYFIK
jgi:A/G-specific adenine glycosylase